MTAASAEGITAPAGKVFLRWKSSSDGKRYYPNAVIAMPYGGLTLTAQWGDAEQAADLIYDFNFDQFGISAEGNSSETVTALKNNSVIELADISSMRAVPAGYAFRGWYLDKECTNGPVQEVLVDDLNQNGNRVYAKWERISTDSGKNTSSTADASSVKAAEDTAVPVVSGTPDTSDHTDLILDFAVMAGAIVLFIVSVVQLRKHH